MLPLVVVLVVATFASPAYASTGGTGLDAGHFHASVSALARDTGSAARSTQPPVSVRPSAYVNGTSPNPIIGWEAMDFTGYTPPDVFVSAGPSHIVETVNLNLAAYTRQGALVRGLSLPSVFGSAGSADMSDPRVRYDSATGRWFLTVTNLSASQFLLAVSRTSDPTLGWIVHSVRPSAPSGCADQPTLGVGMVNVIVSVDLYRDSCLSATNAFLGAEYWVINKTELLSDTTPTAIWHSPVLANDVAIRPVKMDGPSPADYMVSTYWPGNQTTSDTLQLFAISGFPPGSVVVSEVDLPIRTASLAPAAPQKGTPGLLDPGDIRVDDAVWSQGRLWVGFDEGCVLPSRLLTDCIRLLELTTSPHAVVQDFDLDSLSRYYFYPGLDFDAKGNLVIVFGYSSQNDYAGIMVTARLPEDSGGTVQPPIILKSGADVEYSACNGYVCRYGDYFGASRDPADPSVVWVAGEFGRSALLGWGTYVASIQVKAMLTLGYTVSGGGSGPAAPLLHYVFNGSDASVPLHTWKQTFLSDPGAPWHVDADFLSPSGDERYVIAPTDAGTLGGTGNASVSALLNYTTQHRVTLTADGWGSVGYTYGNVSGTVPAGASLPIYVPAGMQLNVTAQPWFALSVFTRWSGAANGSSQLNSLSVVRPTSLTATFTPNWIFVLGVLPGIVVAAVLLVVWHRRRRANVLPPPPPSMPPPAPPP